MTFTEFINKLTHELTLPLPGIQVQLQMMSNRRVREMMEFRQSDQAIKSSVLVLLFPGKENGQPAFVVTLRPTYEGIHSGQISLPGGRFELTDENLMQTALREANEEIGMDPEEVTIIGRLTELYIPPSNYLVQPFVGFTSISPVFNPQPTEVEKIIEIPVNQLLDERNVMEKEISVAGIQFSAPSFVIDGTTIWGATSMILNEFKEILRKTEL
ncbi:MAG: CoA pyrophosphatase [Bacteroidales bacterium]|jgi:8-oxo-dGTP pyrophosphatase MutT (NUDIX family)